MFSKTVVRRVDRGSALSAAPGAAAWNGRTVANAVSLKGARRRLGKSLQSPTLLQQQKTLKCITHSDLTESAQLNTARVEEEPEDAPSEAQLAQPPQSGVAESIQRQPPNASNGRESHARGVTGDSHQQSLKPGDEVTIQVTSAHEMGAMVNITDCQPPQKAFLPYRLFPLSLQSATPCEAPSLLPELPMHWTGQCKALVIHVEEKGDDRAGNTNVVSALDYSKKILWKRLRQIRNLCYKEREVIRGYLAEKNRGGFIVCVAGFPCFLPRSFFTKAETEMYDTPREVFNENHRFSEVDVCILEVDSMKDKVIVSAYAAQSMKSIAQLKIGALIEGSVVHLEPYGAFIEIGSTRKRGLLHVRNMSQRMVRTASEVFAHGEKVKAVIMDVDSAYTRIALSTADLEEESGEILWNKERVMRNAPIMAARLQKELEEARQQHYSGTEPEQLDT